MIWVLLILAAALATPFVIEKNRSIMSDGRRGSAPGHFTELSQGVTHYHLTGPPDGPLIVCVHGLTTPSFVWSALAKGLVALGFRVLVYDLYGRGFSDRPKGAQDQGFFSRQLDDLLSDLNIGEPFHLIGYSMGGAIAATFAAAHPARVRRLVLLASAGMHVPQSALVRFIRARGIAGRWLMLAAYPTQLRRGIRAEREQGNVDPAITDGQERQLEFRGFVPAVLDSLRGILARPLEGAHMALRQSGLPILAIWGGEDDVIPARAIGQLAEWNRTAIHEVIKGAGHGVTYTHSDEVLAFIAAFLPPPGDEVRTPDT